MIIKYLVLASVLFYFKKYHGSCTTYFYYLSCKYIVQIELSVFFETTRRGKVFELSKLRKLIDTVNKLINMAFIEVVEIFLSLETNVMSLKCSWFVLEFFEKIEWPPWTRVKPELFFQVNSKMTRITWWANYSSFWGW